MLHDGFFWATLVLATLLFSIVGVIAWTVRSFQRESVAEEARRRAAQATPKHGPENDRPTSWERINED